MYNENGRKDRFQNPFLYNVYYYDTETGFYYCNSRYYDPENCRWINADMYISTGQGLLGYNMFLYCKGDPVDYKDFDGDMSETIGVLSWGFATGSINSWNPVGWLILGITTLTL